MPPTDGPRPPRAGRPRRRGSLGRRSPDPPGPPSSDVRGRCAHRRGSAAPRAVGSGRRTRSDGCAAPDPQVSRSRPGWPAEAEGPLRRRPGACRRSDGGRRAAVEPDAPGATAWGRRGPAPGRRTTRRPPRTLGRAGRGGSRAVRPARRRERGQRRRANAAGARVPGSPQRARRAGPSDEGAARASGPRGDGRGGRVSWEPITCRPPHASR